MATKSGTVNLSKVVIPPWVFDGSVTIPIALYDPSVTKLTKATFKYTVTSYYAAADVRFNVEGVEIAREDWGAFDFPFVGTRTGEVDITPYVEGKPQIQLTVYAHDFRFDINLATEFPLDLKIILEYTGTEPTLEPGKPEGSGIPTEIPWNKLMWVGVGTLGVVGLVATASLIKSLKR